MFRDLFSALFSLTLLTLSGCGGIHNVVNTSSNTAGQYRQLAVLPVELSSTDTSPQVVALHEEWKKFAADQIQQLLAVKGITAADQGETGIVCHIEVAYGNRALRYFVGFGAGAGHVTVAIEMKGAGGKVLYSGTSKADLAIGAFGGDMKDTVRKTIQAAVKEFGSHL